MTDLNLQIANIEMYKIIPAILHRYRFELVVDEWKMKNGWFRRPYDVNVKVTRR